MRDRATCGYLETWRRIDVWPDSVQVSGETLDSAAAHRCDWCGSTSACVLAGHRARRGSKGVCSARSSGALLADNSTLSQQEAPMGRVIIGMDPHKRSATIEVLDEHENVL